MFKKTLISATVIVVLAGISLFAAEKAKEKKDAQKPGEPSEMAKAEGPQHPGALLDELIAAYKANDRDKMGQVIQKMEQRREKMEKFAQFDQGHRWEHRREIMMHRGYGMQGQQWGRGCGSANQQGWGRGGCGCCQMNYERQERFGPPCRQFRNGPQREPQMQRQNPGWRQRERGEQGERGEQNWGLPPGENRPMRGFGHGWGSDQSSESPDNLNENENDSQVAMASPPEQDW